MTEEPAAFEFADRLSVVLVEPKSPGNIGMTCRAMANFGVRDLRLVNPCPHLEPEAIKFAVGAAGLLESARVFPSLAEALADLQFTVATTRRTGKLRGMLLPAAEVPSLIHRLSSRGRLGLVFGREDAGLTSEEVAACSQTATIGTARDCASLNLAQAVLLFLYEFSRGTANSAPSQVIESPPAQGELEALFLQMEGVLHRIAFLNPLRPQAVMNVLRRLHHRLDLNREELSMLRGMWSQIAWSVRDWRGRKRG